MEINLIGTITKLEIKDRFVIFTLMKKNSAEVKFFASFGDRKIIEEFFKAGDEILVSLTNNPTDKEVVFQYEFQNGDVNYCVTKISDIPSNFREIHIDRNDLEVLIKASKK